jgi:hypothetical protein
VTAGAVGYADGADAAGCARVTIGGKTHAGFVRKRNDLERPRATELEEQIDDQISRNAEEVGNADLLEIRDEVIAQFHLEFHDGGSLLAKIIRWRIPVNEQRSRQPSGRQFKAASIRSVLKVKGETVGQISPGHVRVLSWGFLRGGANVLDGYRREVSRTGPDLWCSTMSSSFQVQDGIKKSDVQSRK